MGLQKLITVLGRLDTYKGGVLPPCEYHPEYLLKEIRIISTFFNIHISHVKVFTWKINEEGRGLRKFFVVIFV